MTVVDLFFSVSELESRDVACFEGQIESPLCNSEVSLSRVKRLVYVVQASK